jgi:16S rRNA (cytosine1402-N4)-methyltransferase
MSEYHTPVLVNDVIQAFDLHVGDVIVDATVGGGGHSLELLRKGAFVIGIDTDHDAIAEANRLFLAQGFNKFKLIQGNFKNICELTKSAGYEKVDGILFDLGVSSHQLDSQNRGFSYRFVDADLDLRLDQTQGIPAYEYINSLRHEELYEIFCMYGEEKFARPIADAIVRARKINPIYKVKELVEIIESVVNKQDRDATLSRVFQSFRILVNEELQSLKSGLNGANELIKSGGKIVVISFHSLEDRIVKLFLRNSDWHVITKKPIIANETEIYLNRRSRSAKLRIAIKK